MFMYIIYIYMQNTKSDVVASIFSRCMFIMFMGKATKLHRIDLLIP